MFKKTFELALISVALVAAWVGVATAAERPYARAIYNAELTRFQMDRNLELDGTVHKGRLQLDLVRNIATVQLFSGFYCPPGRICAQVMPEPRVYSARIVSMKKDQCGGTLTVARRDDRPRDGLAVQIEITDNTTNNCRTFMALPPTQVVVKTATLRGGAGTRSVMTGEALRD